MVKLNQATIAFVESLKSRLDVQGVVLFGSWARGNQRATSDVDLLVVVDEGYKRSVEYLDGQAFEIICTNSQGAKDYYKTDLDATHRFWKLAKILFDKRGEIEELKQFATKLTIEDKKPLGKEALDHFSFDAQDQIRFARDTHSNGNVATANLILHSKMAALAEIYFDTIGAWRPAPKQLLNIIKDNNTALYSLFVLFFSDDANFEAKTIIASDIIKTIFNEKQ